MDTLYRELERVSSQTKIVRICFNITLIILFIGLAVITFMNGFEKSAEEILVFSAWIVVYILKRILIRELNAQRLDIEDQIRIVSSSKE